ncbi:hypothetical protein T06_12726 [Trichinella sp. T6]|nr:hypothetical protein T06_12726 [Trichinella sp. T6]
MWRRPLVIDRYDLHHEHEDHFLFYGAFIVQCPRPHLRQQNQQKMKKPDLINSPCPRFVELSGPERWQCVRKHGLCFGCLRKGHRRGSFQQNSDRPGQHTLLGCENPHRRQNRRQTRRSVASRNARPVAQPDAAVKEKNLTTAPAQCLEAEDAASDRAATELAPVGVHFS